MQVFRVLAQLDRHLGIIGTGYRYQALVDIDGEDLGVDNFFTGDRIDQHIFGLYRETGCSHERSKGDGVGQWAQFHRHAFPCDGY
ncbi:hypothetical protein D3C77_536100 [compost metagenome]